MVAQPQRPQPEPGEAAAPSAGVAIAPAMRDALFDPESWRESLEAYAHATNLAVALVDVEGRLLGPCRNPRPTWSRLQAAQGRADEGCPFALAPPTPCTCIDDALARRALVLARDRTGLVHFTVPLVLDDHPMGVLLAGQVFGQYPEQLRLEHMATRVGLPPQALWQVARLELPVTPATLRVYGHLLATLGQAFLHARYHTLLDAQRLDLLEQRFKARTAALHHEIAARTADEAQRFQARAAIATTVCLPDPELALALDLATTLFRIFQECLTNVARHAGATQVEAALTAEDGWVTLRVQDNGRGMTDAERDHP